MRLFVTALQPAPLLSAPPSKVWLPQAPSGSVLSTPATRIATTQPGCPQLPENQSRVPGFTMMRIVPLGPGTAVLVHRVRDPCQPETVLLLGAEEGAAELELSAAHVRR
eukprot:3539459-Rhodomonas_salina.1